MSILQKKGFLLMELLISFGIFLAVVTFLLYYQNLSFSLSSKGRENIEISRDFLSLLLVHRLLQQGSSNPAFVQEEYDRFLSNLKNGRNIDVVIEDISKSVNFSAFREQLKRFGLNDSVIDAFRLVRIKAFNKVRPSSSFYFIYGFSN